MKKLLVLIFGIFLMAFGTSICNTTGLGIDPFNALSVAFSNFLRIQLGTMILVLQIVLGICVFLYDKKKLGIGTLVPMISFGYFLQFFNWFIPNLIKMNGNLLINIFIFIIGMLIITLGMSIYMHCDVGMVPYDCLAFIVSERMNKNPFLLRIIIDIAISLFAYTIGGPISIGTVLLALFIGPLIRFFRSNTIKKILSKNIMRLPFRFK